MGIYYDRLRRLMGLPLDTGSEAENDGGNEETKATTEKLTKGVAEERTKEASSLVGRDDVCRREASQL